MSDVRVAVKPFRVAKAGNLARECDDAHWPKSAEEGVGAAYRAAVSDGATETSYSRLWATLLVRAYFRGQLNDPAAEGVLSDLRSAWATSTGRKKLPWYAQEKVQQGAYATLVGLTLEAGNDPDRHGGDWTALAVGDSCLAHVRGDELLVCFPLTRSDQFAARPYLLSSKSDLSAELGPHVQTSFGEWRSDDAFYLMTDALSAWFLAEVERGERPWQYFRDFDTSEEPISFVDLVSSLRDSHAMKNDDVTLVRLDLL